MIPNCLKIALIVSLGIWAEATRAEDHVLDSMDSLRLQVPADKAKAELVEGKLGKAVRLAFADDCKNVYVQTRCAGKPAWDQMAGFSFWVKGDGSDHLGGIEIIFNGDYSLRYACAFPIDGTEWRKVVVAWGDLLPETANAAALAIDAWRGNAPSKLGAIWFGKWWYWRDYSAHSYTIDDLRLEPALPADETDFRPVGDPLARVRAKLDRHDPIAIVLMGDSLTDTQHWANREHNWPAMLKAKLAAAHGAEISLVNSALGGTELRQNLVLIPRWSSKHADADLVIVCFGGNDWSAGMRGAAFEEANRDAIDRIRRATGGRAGVMLCTTCPSVERWDTMAELSVACRNAAKAANSALADIDAAFHEAAASQKEREQLFVDDKTHLSKAGHELFAETVWKAIEGE